MKRGWIAQYRDGLDPALLNQAQRGCLVMNKQTYRFVVVITNV
jgi:hypothetical protein